MACYYLRGMSEDINDFIDVGMRFTYNFFHGILQAFDSIIMIDDSLWLAPIRGDLAYDWWHEPISRKFDLARVDLMRVDFESVNLKGLNKYGVGGREVSHNVPMTFWGGGGDKSPPRGLHRLNRSKRSSTRVTDFSLLTNYDCSGPTWAEDVPKFIFTLLYLTTPYSSLYTRSTHI